MKEKLDTYINLQIVSHYRLIEVVMVVSDCHSTPVSVTNILINKIIINKNETFTHPATPSENKKKK